MVTAIADENINWAWRLVLSVHMLFGPLLQTRQSLCTMLGENSNPELHCRRHDVFIVKSGALKGAHQQMDGILLRICYLQ